MNRLMAALLIATAAACVDADSAEQNTPADRAATDTAADAGNAAGSAQTMTYTVVFTRAEQPHAVERAAIAAEDTLRTALAALLAGPTAAEREAGVTSWFSAETADALRSIASEGTHLIVDFGDLRALIPNASSSLGSTMLLAELNGTVFANSDARSVEYRMDGSCEAFGEFVQRGCIRYDRSDSQLPGS